MLSLFEKPLQQQIEQKIKQKYQQPYQSLNLDGLNMFWSYILKKRDWTLLRQLYLQNCYINDEGFRLFANLQWVNLTNLFLNNNFLTFESIKLLNNKQLPRLQSLKKNNIEEEGFILIFQKPSKMAYINLIACNITLIRPIPLSEYNLQNLRQLKLSENSIGSNGVKYLVKGNMPKLGILMLSTIYLICGQLRNWIVRIQTSNESKLALFDQSVPE